MAAEDLNLGSAIGLQGQPKDYASQYTNMAMRQNQGIRKREASDKKASEKAYKMFELKPGAMLSGREDYVKHSLGRQYDSMSQSAANREDPKTNPEIQKQHAQNLFLLDSVAKEREAFYKDLELAATNPAKYKINQEVYNTYANGKGFGEDVPFYQSGQLLIANGDPQKRISELGAAVKPKVTVQDVVGPGGTITQTDISEIDPADNQFWAEKFYNGALDGSDIDGAVGLKNIEKNLSTPGTPLYDAKFSLLSPEEKSELVKTAFIKEAVKGFEVVQGESRKQNISRPPVTNININNGGTSGANNQQIGQEEFNIPAYTTNAEGKTVPDKSRNFVVPAQNPGYVISLKKGELILPVGPNMLDLTTLKQPQGGRGNLEIMGGYSATVPVYKQGTATAEGADKRRSDVSGLPIPGDLLQQAEEDGLVEYKLKFIGNGLDASGRTHPIMFDVTQPTTDAAILKESLKDQIKVEQGLTGAKKFTAEKNKGTDEVERKTKDGRIAIFNSKTKQFIRWK